MLDLDMIKEELTELRLVMLNAKTMGEEMVAWAAWCKLWDQKERLEESQRSDCKEYVL